MSLTVGMSAGSSSGEGSNPNIRLAPSRWLRGALRRNSGNGRRLKILITVSTGTTGISKESVISLRLLLILASDRGIGIGWLASPEGYVWHPMSAAGQLGGPLAA